MKTIFFLLICSAVWGCKTHPEQVNKVQEQKDSTFPSTHLVSDSAFDQSMFKVYDSAKDSLLTESELSILKSVRLNDSITYCIFQLNNGNCQNQYLGIQKNLKNIEIIPIAEGCDADFSIPEYSYSEATFDSSNVVRTTVYREKASSKYLIKSGQGLHFKEGFTLENSETKKDTANITRVVEPTGTVIEKKSDRRF